jgi:hypothetical protein
LRAFTCSLLDGATRVRPGAGRARPSPPQEPSAATIGSAALS